MNDWFGKQFAALAAAFEARAATRTPPENRVELLQQRVSYDPLTGVLFRLERPLSDFSHCKEPERIHRSWNSRNANKEIPLQLIRGHYLIKVDKTQYGAGRAAWILAHGKEPGGYIGYRDRDPTNLELKNLYVKG